MSKFPEPPSVSELRQRDPERVTWVAGQELWRIYFRGGPHPTYWDSFRTFGPTTARFDHHLPPPRIQKRGVLYTASSGVTCLAEVFQDTRLVDRSAREPWLVGFALARPLLLLDLTGSWPTRAGASMVMGSGPRPRARRWSRAFYEAFPDIHGLLYPSSMRANLPMVALYERGAPALPTCPVFHRPLADPALITPLRNAACEIGYGLV